MRNSCSTKFQYFWLFSITTTKETQINQKSSKRNKTDDKQNNNK